MQSFVKYCPEPFANMRYKMQEWKKDKNHCTEAFFIINEKFLWYSFGEKIGVRVWKLTLKKTLDLVMFAMYPILQSFSSFYSDYVLCVCVCWSWICLSVSSDYKYTDMLAG